LWAGAIAIRHVYTQLLYLFSLLTNIQNVFTDARDTSKLARAVRGLRKTLLHTPAVRIFTAKICPPIEVPAHSSISTADTSLYCRRPMTAHQHKACQTGAPWNRSTATAKLRLFFAVSFPLDKVQRSYSSLFQDCRSLPLLLSSRSSRTTGRCC
jgi:hypothetical protein